MDCDENILGNYFFIYDNNKIKYYSINNEFIDIDNADVIKLINADDVKLIFKSVKKESANTAVFIPYVKDYYTEKYYRKLAKQYFSDFKDALFYGAEFNSDFANAIKTIQKRGLYGNTSIAYHLHMTQNFVAYKKHKSNDRYEYLEPDTSGDILNSKLASTMSYACRLFTSSANGKYSKGKKIYYVIEENNTIYFGTLYCIRTRRLPDTDSYISEFRIKSGILKSDEFKVFTDIYSVNNEILYTIVNDLTSNDVIAYIDQLTTKLDINYTDEIKNAVMSILSYNGEIDFENKNLNQTIAERCLENTNKD